MEIELRICHMYPDLLNLYGDRGNVLSLIRRAQLRGIKVKLVPVSIGDDFDEKDFDIVFLGEQFIELLGRICFGIEIAVFVIIYICYLIVIVIVFAVCICSVCS